MAVELGAQFSLQQALTYGLVPLIVNSSTIEKTLQAYIGLYLEEEVKTEALVRKIGSFAKFLEVISFSHAGVPNVTNIAHECSLPRSLVEGYFSVLQDLLLAFLLPIFTRRTKRKTIEHAKFYYFDTGSYKNLRLTGFLDSEQEVNGPGLEGLVAQHLRAWSDYLDKNLKLFYWRTQRGLEVDFILYGKTHFYAIEIKNSTTILPKDLSGLNAFAEEYPEASLLFIYRSQERLRKGNILCFPVKEFLLRLTPEMKDLSF